MRLNQQRQFSVYHLGLLGLATFFGLSSALLAEEEILEEKISIPPGQAYVQSLNNRGEPTRLEVLVNSNSPITIQVMTLQAHTLRKAGLDDGDGIVLERTLEEAGSISGEFTAGEGSWWIHVQNQANYPNNITLKVSTSDGKGGSPAPQPSQPNANPATDSGGSDSSAGDFPEPSSPEENGGSQDAFPPPSDGFADPFS